MQHEYVSHPVDEKGYVSWTDTENNTWEKLVSRQQEIIQDRACKEFLEGISQLEFTDQVPQLPELNAKLDSYNGWGVEAVPAIIQPQEFFTLLTKKRFPAATFIRRPEDLDYLQEPDIFHELYGHTPLLTVKPYGDFMEEFGRLALRAEPKDRRRLFRLFWFTIEFGLIQESQGLRAYGGGILSSIGETQYCLTDEPKTAPFDALTALRTPYRIDIMQPLYFVIKTFDDLFSILDQDVLGLVQKAKELGDLEAPYPEGESVGGRVREETDTDKESFRC